MKWRPIETAPKDGTAVLLGGRWKPFDILKGGEWHQQIFRWGSYSSANDAESEWWSDAHIGVRSDHWNVEWTHWMPLPEPPEDKP